DWSKIIFPRILQEFEDRNVLIITIFLGANDSCTEDNVIQHVPLSRYITNTTELVSTAISSFPDAKVFVITPPPVIGQDWTDYLLKLGNTDYKPDRFNPVIREYHNACFQIVKQFNNPNVVTVDSWTTLFGTNGEELSEEEKISKLQGHFVDGLHFAKTANEKLANEILRIVREKFTEISPEKLERIWPDWDKVNVKTL
ncbi:isoamyl acetate-hydrolyzing esterase, partial [Nowakowskiella sp. JEL0078]